MITEYKMTQRKLQAPSLLDLPREMLIVCADSS